MIAQLRKNVIFTLKFVTQSDLVHMSEIMCLKMATFEDENEDKRKIRGDLKSQIST